MVQSHILFTIINSLHVHSVIEVTKSSLILCCPVLSHLCPVIGFRIAGMWYEIQDLVVQFPGFPEFVNTLTPNVTSFLNLFMSVLIDQEPGKAFPKSDHSTKHWVCFPTFKCPTSVCEDHYENYWRSYDLKTSQWVYFVKHFLNQRFGYIGSFIFGKNWGQVSWFQCGLRCRASSLMQLE